MRLRARYALTMVAMTVTMAAALSGILLWHGQAAFEQLTATSTATVSDKLIAQLRRRGDAMTRSLAANLTNPLYHYDMEAMLRLLTTAKQPDVLYVYVYDAAGTIVHDGSENIVRFGEPVDTVSLKMLARVSAPSGAEGINQSNDSPVAELTDAGLVVARPIWIGDTLLGGVTMTLSLADMRQDIERVENELYAISQATMRRNGWLIVGTTLALVGVGVVLSITVAGRLIRPIRALTYYAKEVGQGRYALAPVSAGRDELGELVDSFRQMSHDLQQTTVSKNYIENILASMSDMLVVLDERGNIRAINRALWQQLGYAETGLVGRRFDELFPEQHRAEAVDWLAGLGEAGKTAAIDSFFRAGDGRAIPIALSGATMREAGGQAQGTVCVAQDISERLRMQETLRAAKEQAEQANLAKSQFLANMSHELRTPLNGVVGMLELLLDSALNDEQQRLATTAQRSGESLLGVINDVLDFSKIEAGKLDIERIAYSLTDTINDVVAQLGVAAEAKQLPVDVSIDPALPGGVYGDPGRVRQVLLNLINNAIKFTDAGRVTITAERRGQRFHVSVCDTGCGISPQAQTRLFASFSQADASTTRRFGGTGLGLAICKQLVLLMGGEIGLDSAPGQGSTFWFSLPLEAAPEVAVALPERAVDRAAPLRGRVLLAEDNPVNQQVAMQILRRFGLSVEPVSDGAAAVAATERQRFDLVLMDCQMPELDGYQATQRIRAREAERGGPRLPIIALTANALTGDRERCLAVGMDDYLTKPFRRDELHALLSRWLTPATPRPPAAVAETASALPASADLAVIDSAVIDELRALCDGEDDAFLADLVGEYRTSAEALLAQLRRAVSEGDAERVCQASHSLKSASGNLGLRRLTERCYRLEKTSRAGELRQAEALLAEIERGYRQGSEALNQLPGVAGGLNPEPVAPAV